MNNNCNDNYDRIKKKIEEERERCKYCYIQGPRGAKGERGERGPATIKIMKVMANLSQWHRSLPLKELHM